MAAPGAPGDHGTFHPGLRVRAGAEEAAMSGARLQERSGAGVRDGVQGPQERGQVQDQEVPRGAAGGQGHPGDRGQAGDAKENEEGDAEGCTGAEASRAVPGCLEIAQRRGQGKGETDRSGEECRRGREAWAVAQEG